MLAEASRAVIVRGLVVACLAAGLAAPAAAIPPFYKEFMKLYADGTDEAYADKAKEAKCFVCHQGKKKKNRNAYGDALHEYLDKKDKKDVEKIVASLETVAGQSSDPDNPDAPTFGELIESGELPGGSLEDSKKEPDELEE